MFDDVTKVVGMLDADIFDAKVIHNEHKNDGSPFVVPEAGRGGTLVVAMVGQMFGEQIIGKFAGLLQPKDTLCDLKVYPVIEGILGEVVFINEFLWDL